MNLVCEAYCSNYRTGMTFLWMFLLFVVSFTESQDPEQKVVGPDSPVSALAGEDLVLPCFLKPSISAVDMRVEWFRLDTHGTLVHLYKDKRDMNEKQDESYRGRTSLFYEELQKGNASLKLSALTLSDEGEYKCLVEYNSWYDDITVIINVEILGTHPVITVESYDNSGGVNLVCESRGWNPEPAVLWLDKDGATLPAEDPHMHKHSDGFSVKRRITVYYYSDSKRFYCRLQHKHHMMETDIIIESNVFYTWKWAVCCSVLTCVSTVGLILTAVMCHKKGLQDKKQNAERERQRAIDELKRIQQHAVDVTLDPDTANPYLILFADGKQVTHGDIRQNLPDTPQRFNECPCVLGKQSFSSGRFYYEVQVKEKTGWDFGVAKESINRKGNITLNPQNGFWSICLRNENQYTAWANPSVPLTLREKVETVGVFVDYDYGLVSFYDVKSGSHIYSFTGQSFTEKLYPYFCPGYNNRGKNSALLIITDVNN